MREAKFTSEPTTLYLVRLSEPMLPTTTEPVFTPMPMARRGMPSASFSALISSMAACIDRAQATARAG